jgi:hypothetical protein
MASASRAPGGLLGRPQPGDPPGVVQRREGPACLLYEEVQLRMRDIAMQVVTHVGMQAVIAEGYRAMGIEIVDHSSDVLDS